MGRLLSFFADFFATQIIGGANVLSEVEHSRIVNKSAESTPASLWCHRADGVSKAHRPYVVNLSSIFWVVRKIFFRTCQDLRARFCKQICCFGRSVQPVSLRTLGGAKELVVLLWLSGDIKYKQWTKRVGFPFKFFPVCRK